VCAVAPCLLQLLLHQSVPLRAGTALLGLEKPLLDSAALLDGSAVQVCAMELPGGAERKAHCRPDSGARLKRPCARLLLLWQGDTLLQLDTVLAAYQARNVTTAFANAYPVWKVGWGRGGACVASC
jgi:hypothetical protein